MHDPREYFHRGGLNCAETALMLLIQSGVVDLPPESIRLATGFGGGMQRGETCGAVIASVMAIGATCGRCSSDDPREPSTEAVRKFISQFDARFGCHACDSLRASHMTNAPLRSEEMYEGCSRFVEAAVDITERLISGDNC